MHIYQRLKVLRCTPRKLSLANSTSSVISFLSRMTFNDDEEVVKPQEITTGGRKRRPFVSGKTQVTVINKKEAPLEETNLDVLLKLTGSGDNKDRLGVDLVTVIDVSGSMQEENKIEKLKVAMQFLIKKLSSIDRLTVIIFSDSAQRLFPLRQVTEEAQAKIIEEVKALKAGGNTNIADGLRTALQVLDDRRFKEGRVGAVMLMSDGAENRGKAAEVDVSKVPVHTFGFGANHDPRVLQEVAKKSNGGTFADVQNDKNLSLAFSQCLAGLLTVVVQDLRLTVKQFDGDSTILNVFAGNYPQTENSDNSRTIFFGNLYNKEVRNIIVELSLPGVKDEIGVDVLRVSYTYETGVVGDPLFEANPIKATVTRTGSASAKELDEIIAERNRLTTAKVMKSAREKADEQKLDEAKVMLTDAQNSLEDVEVDKPHPVLESLKTELQTLLDYMESPETYNKKGRPFALSSETSHERQRYAARGDDVGENRLFATPRMDALYEQAKQFDKDPDNFKLPTEEEDLKEEIIADPLGPIIGPLRYQIQIAIDALKSIDTILSTAGSAL